MRGARPKHIGFIPDGNRRWAVNRGLRKEQGYSHGVTPGIQLLKLCAATGISEISIFGFTKDNVRRSAAQRRAFSQACVEFARGAIDAGAALQIVGDTRSRVFPPELRDLPCMKGKRKGKSLRVNLLVNYDWRWDLVAEGDQTDRGMAGQAPHLSHDVEPEPVA